MSNKMYNGKYRIVVSLDENEYQMLRKLAFDMEMTLNEMLREVAKSVARDRMVNG